MMVGLLLFLDGVGWAFPFFVNFTLAHKKKPILLNSTPPADPFFFCMMSMVRVGLDMSLNSTGMAIVDGKNIVLLFNPQNQKQCRIYWQRELQGFHFTIRPFQTKPHTKALKPKLSKQEKKQIQIQKISSIINNILRELQQYYHSNTRIYIEDYAYGMTNSSSMSVLHELGGALKYMLAKKNIPYEAISPSSAKKRFAGTGRASKLDMYTALQNLFPIPLWQIFGKSPGPKLPNPIQDIVDAFALAWIN